MPTATDLAITNVHIDKRGGGSLDAQIDRHLREEAAQRRSAAKAVAVQRWADKASAKTLLADHLDAIVAKHGPKLGTKDLRDMLTSWAKWEPGKLIAFVAKFHTA